LADGGEAWVVTSHKGGVSGFRFSPDSKRLVLTAADQPSKDEEDRKKVKDDTLVIDRDIRMTHLWLFDIEKKSEKADHRRRVHGQRSAMVTRRHARYLHDAAHAKSGRWRFERPLDVDGCHR
jgi:dipeptidyl aminopeptidase/acylaminoacyl peptidase